MLALLLVVGCSTTQTPTTEEPTTEEPTTEEPATEEPAEEPAEPEGPKAAEGTLTVGTGGELNGHYIAGITNSSYDKWIRNLLWDYGTYVTDEGGQFILNSTVVNGEPEVTENEDGSKTYTFVVNEGLKWNTGEEITAKDFVFDILWSASPEFFQAGAGMANSSYDGLVGQSAYQKGETRVFEGVKLVDDMTFSVTISAERLPYFYEPVLVTVGPAPMFRYAPNLDISPEGNSLVVKEGYEVTAEDTTAFVEATRLQIEGLNADIAALEKGIEDALAEDPEYDRTDDDASIAGIKETVTSLEAEITEAEAGNVDVTRVLLRANATDIVEKFAYAPDVTSGAYQFLVFENQSVTVELNPNYAGDFRGNKPTIQRVHLRNVNEEIDVDMVISGELDIAAGIIEEGKITKAKEAETADLVSYPRNGYGVLAFKTNKAPVDILEVRQAVAFLLDRQAIVDGTSGGYGVVGQGQYGLSQWMYVEKGEEFLDEVEARGTAYTLDIDRANELLDETPYLYEADGTTLWDAAKAAELVESEGENFDYFRHDAEGTVLQINQGGASAAVLNVIAGQMPETARYAGMKYTTQLIDFNVLLNEYYNLGNMPPEQLTYHNFSLGTSFTAVYDPYYSYHSSQLGTGNNNTVTNDPEADRLTTELRQMDPTDTEGYANKWLEWQLWYNENLPDIPLYSQEYFDVFNTRITGLETTPVWDWSMDIADIKFAN